MLNLTVYVDSELSVQFSNWSALTSKWSKINLVWFYKKKWILGVLWYAESKNVLRYFIIGPVFKLVQIGVLNYYIKYCATARNFQLHSIQKYQEILNCTVLCNSKKSSIAQYWQYCAIANIFNCTILRNSKKFVIAQYCAIAWNFQLELSFFVQNSTWINLKHCFIQYTMYNTTFTFTTNG